MRDMITLCGAVLRLDISVLRLSVNAQTAAEYNRNRNH